MAQAFLDRSNVVTGFQKIVSRMSGERVARASSETSVVDGALLI